VACAARLGRHLHSTVTYHQLLDLHRKRLIVLTEEVRARNVLVCPGAEWVHLCAYTAVVELRHPMRLVGGEVVVEASGWVEHIAAAVVLWSGKQLSGKLLHGRKSFSPCLDLDERWQLAAKLSCK